MTHNEKTLNNYIFQIRDTFCLQQVMDHTGVPKTSCHRLLKKWEKEGKIKRVSVSSRPVKYRFNYKTSPLKLIMAGTREAEVEAKAEKLGVCARTIYRNEKQEIATVDSIQNSIIKICSYTTEFTVYDIMNSSGLYLSIISRYISKLIDSNFIEQIRQDKHTRVFRKVTNDSKTA